MYCGSHAYDSLHPVAGLPLHTFAVCTRDAIRFGLRYVAFGCLFTHTTTLVPRFGWLRYRTFTVDALRLRFTGLPLHQHPVYRIPVAARLPSRCYTFQLYTTGAVGLGYLWDTFILPQAHLLPFTPDYSYRTFAVQPLQDTLRWMLLPAPATPPPNPTLCRILAFTFAVVTAHYHLPRLPPLLFVTLPFVGSITVDHTPHRTARPRSDSYLIL